MNQHPNIRREHDLHRVKKTWGEEVWVDNTNLYCGKKMIINPQMTSSMHFHIKKTETIYVQSGCLTLELLENKQTNKYHLQPGDSILIEPGMMHRLCNYENKDLILFEFSTEHFDDDSYRIS